MCLVKAIDALRHFYDEKNTQERKLRSYFVNRWHRRNMKILKFHDWNSTLCIHSLELWKGTHHSTNPKWKYFISRKKRICGNKMKFSEFNIWYICSMFIQTKSNFFIFSIKELIHFFCTTKLFSFFYSSPTARRYVSTQVVSSGYWKNHCLERVCWTLLVWLIYSL